MSAISDPRLMIWKSDIGFMIKVPKDLSIQNFIEIGEEKFVTKRVILQPK